jgi:hypothetical protein
MYFKYKNNYIKEFKGIIKMNKQNNNLYNESNYNSELDNNDKQLYFSKFIEIINNYIHYVIKHINIHNKLYFKFIIIKGIENLKHIFMLLLTYTKNIDLVIQHCQKSYCYFVEFIEQMNNSNELIKLNSKDATLFMYRKTIFDINQNYRKTLITNKKTSNILNYTNNCINQYLTIYINLINYNFNIETLTYINKNLIKLFNQIIFKNNNFLLILQCINLLTILLINNNFEIDNIYKLIELFIIKSSNNKLNYKKIEKNINNFIFNNNINNENLINYIIQ